MSKVVRKPLIVVVDSNASDFPAEMSLALSNILDRAHSLGVSVDWTTLYIEGPEIFETREASGERHSYSDGLMPLRVDGITIEDD